MRVWWKKFLYAALGLAGFWLGSKYILPIVLPFLLGGLIALAAEPAVKFCTQRLSMKRGVAAVLSVALTLVLLSATVSLVGAVAVKEIGNLADAVPDVQSGIAVLQNWLSTAAEKVPAQLRPMARQTVEAVFTDRGTFVQQLTGKLPGVLTRMLSGVGNGVMGVGTGILAAFLISARLPKLRTAVQNRLPDGWHTKWKPALQRAGGSLWGWLKAQGKLAVITWSIVTAGFLLLRIPYAPVWAALVAMVDAIPLLGTGVVLGPFAAISFLQGNSIRGVGLLCTYAAAAITRTVLEPRLVGKQLGLDPLVTLVALYTGYRFFGILGLLLAPILTSVVKNLMITRN